MPGLIAKCYINHHKNNLCMEENQSIVISFCKEKIDNYLKMFGLMKRHSPKTIIQWEDIWHLYFFLAWIIAEDTGSVYISHPSLQVSAPGLQKLCEVVLDIYMRAAGVNYKGSQHMPDQFSEERAKNSLALGKS